MTRAQKTLPRLVTAGLWVVLAGYALVLVKIVLLKYGLYTGLRSFNFIPFRFVYELLHPQVALDVALKNVLGNFAIFIPLGVLAPTLCSRVDRWWKGALAGLCLSALFELTQGIFDLGAVDIDDLILNTLGAAAGSALYFGLLARLRPAWKPRAAALAFLCVFGLAGLLGLWLYAPGELPQIVEHVNVEALGGLARDSYTISGTLERMVADSAVCSAVMPRDATDAEAALAQATYPLADGAALILETYTYQFSPNGNIQKTICTYTALDLASAAALAAGEGTVFADLWLDGTGACTAVLLTVFG